jgi:hypothetical protein
MLEGQEMKDACRESEGRGNFIGRSRRHYVEAPPQVRVTLSVDLLNHLRSESQATQVPLRWLVAGLVCDTMSTDSVASCSLNSRL